MITERDLKCVVPGSFSKFKPEIDLAIDELKDLGITVLAPDKGWLYKPPTRLYALEDRQGFRPLPSEQGMDIKQIEDQFLDAITKSDFIYIVNPDGYIGETVSMEIGAAVAAGVPIYSQFPIDPNLDPDPMFAYRISFWIKMMTIPEAIKDAREVGHYHFFTLKDVLNSLDRLDL